MQARLKQAELHMYTIVQLRLKRRRLFDTCRCIVPELSRAHMQHTDALQLSHENDNCTSTSRCPKLADGTAV
jgi:hypothetical protein